jgi:hypothetical protein
MMTAKANVDMVNPGINLVDENPVNGRIKALCRELRISMVLGLTLHPGRVPIDLEPPKRQVFGIGGVRSD